LTQFAAGLRRMLARRRLAEPSGALRQSRPAANCVKL